FYRILYFFTKCKWNNAYNKIILKKRFSSVIIHFFFLIIRRPPRSTLFPTRRSSDLTAPVADAGREMRNRVPPPATRSSCRSPFRDRKSTRLNSSHVKISYAVFCLKKKITKYKWNQADKKVKLKKRNQRWRQKN